MRYWRALLFVSMLLVAGSFAQDEESDLEEDPYAGDDIVETATAKVTKVPESSWGTPLMSYDSAGNRMIPNWSFGGSTQLNKNFVRLTPDRQSKQGWLWNTSPNKLKEWAIVVKLRISGSAKRLFGDGVGLWYTKARQPGPVLGGMDRWTGLGLFFDTFQNTDLKHYHQHPFLSAMVNDGRKEYGADDKHYKNGCHAQFRYHEGRHDFSVKNHTKVWIVYRNSEIKAFVEIRGRTTQCFTMQNVNLPTGYFFGITASTGHLADNHDVLGFHLHDIEGVDESELFTLSEGPAEEWEDELDPEEREEVDRIVAKTEAVVELQDKMDHVQHDLEHTMASVKYSLEGAIKKVSDGEKAGEKRIATLEDKINKKVEEKLNEYIDRMVKLEQRLKIQVDSEVTSSAGGWKIWFLLLLVLIFGIVFYAWRQYKWLMKRHIL